jgi:exonuclease III
MTEKTVREKHRNYAFSKVAAIVEQQKADVARLQELERPAADIERAEARLASWEDLLMYAEAGRAAVTTLQKLQEKES